MVRDYPCSVFTQKLQTLRKEEINIKNPSLSEYKTNNGEFLFDPEVSSDWQIISAKAEINEIEYDFGRENYQDMTFTFARRRRDSHEL